MDKHSSVYVAGHRGLVGSAILRRLESEGYANLVTRTRSELDLTDQPAVNAFFAETQPEYVFLAAARVGGIWANSHCPAEFIRDNLMVQCNVIDAAYRCGCKKFVFLGASCLYPKFAPQPMKEEHLLVGELEPTNQWYAIAKIAGIKMGQAYRQQYGFNVISLMPTNLYGPGDDFDPMMSHVMPGLMRRFHEAKINDAPEVTVWGTGKARREFLHVDDLADATVHLMLNYESEEIINVGIGEDISIAELVNLIKKVVDYRGRIVYDSSKPDGTPRKLLDVSRLSEHGWRARIGLREGLEQTYRWFVEHEAVAT